MARNEPAKDLQQVIRWLAVLWLIELADTVVTTLVTGGIPEGGGVIVIRDGLFDAIAGLHPLDLSQPLLPQLVWLPLGMIGAPLLHAGWYHLIQNSLALGLLGYLSLRFSNRLTYVAIGYAAIFSALLTWVIAPPDQIHVGASGIIFGLVGFLLANGLIRRGCLPLVIAFAVFVIYGGALIGMVPGMAGAHISWQMHLGGFIGGLCASWHLRNERQ